MKEFSEEAELPIQDIIRTCQCKTHNKYCLDYDDNHLNVECALFKNIKKSFGQDCTMKCQSIQHGDHITAAITSREVSDVELCSYITYVCKRCGTVRDSVGRTALHVAASCGRTELVRWLIEQGKADINARDKESGFTALHRSIFYGKIATAVQLMKLGANLNQKDYEGLTFLDQALLHQADIPLSTSGRYYYSSGKTTIKLANLKRKDWGLIFSDKILLHQAVPSSRTGLLHTLGANLNQKGYEDRIFLDQANQALMPLSTSGELFTWGDNTNNSLGTQHPRSTPEVMSIFHKTYPKESVQDFFIDQYHSVILSQSGNVYSCGHGHGGRLGLGNDRTELAPKQITFERGAVEIKECSIAKNHSLFLSTDGQIYSCGLNTHGVLGFDSSVTEVVRPKAVKCKSFIESVLASEYHSVAWNSHAMFTWGLNAGQLGLGTTLHYLVYAPKKVTILDFRESSDRINLVCTSTGAIVISTMRGFVYTLHDHECRPIAWKLHDILAISAVGGKFNEELYPELRNKSSDLRIAIVKTDGSVRIWQSFDRVFRMCHFSMQSPGIVTDVSFNACQLLLVTKHGEAFKGDVTRKTYKRGVEYNGRPTIRARNGRYRSSDRKIDGLIVKLEKIPLVYRALKIRSDPKGSNFGIIQSWPYKNSRYHRFEEQDIYSVLNGGLMELLQTADLEDGLVDVVIKASNREFLAHRYILASRSPYFARVLSENPNITPTIDLDKFDADIFDQILRFIYGRRENEICLGKFPKESDKKKSVLKAFRDAAIKFELDDLKYLFQEVKTDLGDFLPPLFDIWTFDRFAFQDFFDVWVKCSDNTILRAHKCVLVARSEYFSSMFSVRWMGRNKSEITLSFTADVVDRLLDFLYTDAVKKLDEIEVDKICDIFKLADLTLVKKLGQICENALADSLTIKNALPLLTFALSVAAVYLKTNCCRFVQLNMANFLELRLLEDLDDAVLAELSEFYQQALEFGSKQITPYSTAPSFEQMTGIWADMSNDRDNEVSRSNKVKRKKSAKRISSSQDDVPVAESSIDPSQFSGASSSSTNDPDLSTSLNSVSLTPGGELVGRRVKAITAARNLDLSDEENFTALNKSDGSKSLSGSFVDEYEFPLLSSAQKASASRNTAHKSDARRSMPKLSQKQRKRLSSESGGSGAVSSPPLAESPKNPWKVLPSPVTEVNRKEEGMESIIIDEKKQKENLVRMQNKPLALTQLEDKAMVELERFYGVGQVEEELISVERVTTGMVAAPIWVPK
ncbi:inhibitor of Bruton tyrosine kinase isoform X2 [Sitophilus oryzae]|uniref:Inhibitor of Bruton tyrosine kinase isoform X2 n=1 Tax=Sitophilus oryzae TaxID=7048 RepID=A0A6J2XBG2_SITOR|nr:inhibitor of Bruton tyrosine kinase isoform X2 [Sitophilus oryzae]